jgi:ABC-2 type transport system permease protein
MDEERVAGQIYDIGYQHYDGARLGRANAFRTLFTYTFATAFGVGRGEKAKAVPAIVCALIFVPVFVQIAAASTVGPQFVNYGRQLQFSAFFLALFAAAQAPEVIVTDRQFGVLPLYLARALRAPDYAITKLCAFVAAFLMLTLLPGISLFTGKVLLSETPWQAFTGDWKSLLPLVGGTVLAAVYMASIGLALASFASKRAFGTAAVISFFMLMVVLSNIGRGILSVESRRYAELISPFAVMTGFANWLFDVQAQHMVVTRFGAFRRPPRPGSAPQLAGQWYLYVLLATCAIAVALLLIRYWRSEE